MTCFIPHPLNNLNKLLNVGACTVTWYSGYSSFALIWYSGSLPFVVLRFATHGYSKVGCKKINQGEKIGTKTSLAPCARHKGATHEHSASSHMLSQSVLLNYLCWFYDFLHPVSLIPCWLLPGPQASSSSGRLFQAWWYSQKEDKCHESARESGTIRQVTMWYGECGMWVRLWHMWVNCLLLKEKGEGNLWISGHECCSGEEGGASCPWASHGYNGDSAQHWLEDCNRCKLLLAMNSIYEKASVM